MLSFVEMNRIGVVCRGWLGALPFVLGGPLAFWILFVPTQMISWSWAGLPDLCQYAIPLIFMAVLAHVFVFLVAGLPMFFVFWKRASVVWFLPVSLTIGGLMGAVLGLPEYYRGGFLSVEKFSVCLGYGFATAFGCWHANRRVSS